MCTWLKHHVKNVHVEGNIQCKLGCLTHWVLVGDFNMSKDVHQTNSVDNKFMKQREVAI